MIKPNPLPGKEKRTVQKPQRFNQPDTLPGQKRGLINNQAVLLIAILIITFIAFLPSLSNQFITTWDDNVYVTENPMITHLNWESIRGFFTTQRNGTYVPLPLLTWAVEFKLFGLNPFPYHLDNLLLHLLCTLLVFYFFRLLRLPSIYAALGALFFGIHPMHVESVVWVTERKDLLFCLFYLGSLIIYIKFILSENRKLIFFLLTLLLFVFSLFSKIQAVSLPLSLFLLDYWFNRPLKWKLIYEKIPFFILSLIFGLGGYFILQNLGGIDIHDPFSLPERILLALYSLSAYIVKLILPLNLSCHYPYPVIPGETLPVLFYLNLVFLLGLAILILLTVRKTRAVVFGVLFFLFNVMFLLQFMRAGEAYQADRFSYISYIGLFFIVAWGAYKFASRNKSRQMIITGLSIFVTAFFFTNTYARCKDWKDSITLWNDVISKYDNAPIAYDNRGVAYGELGQWDNTIADFSRAIEIDPGYAKAYYDRGIAYGNLSQWNLAIVDFSKAIEIDQKYTDAFSDRGNAYSNLGQLDKAIADFSKAIEIDPGNSIAYYDRGNAHSNLGQWNEAIADYSRAIKIDPKYSLAYSNRGAVYGNLGMFDKAIADFSKAIEIDPNNTKAYSNREIAYRRLQQEQKP
jgi:tetratricopeptide (TPR) repeat protein